jgi:hypothetical protein
MRKIKVKRLKKEFIEKGLKSKKEWRRLKKDNR